MEFNNSFNNFNNQIKEEEIKPKNKTLKIAGYLLLSTIVFSGLAFGGYFLYNKYYLNKQDVNNEDLNELFKNIDKADVTLSTIDNQDNLESDLKIDVKAKDCLVGNERIKDGEKIKLYSRKIVTIYEDCEKYAKFRKCINGKLAGDSVFRYKICEKKLDCLLPNGNILKNGQSIKLYLKKYVPFGDNCEKYATMRTCKNTVLTGDSNYVYDTCSVSYDNACRLDNGMIMANNQTHVFYSKSKVPFGDKCTNYSKTFTCVDTELRGGDPKKYPYWSCIVEPPKNCYIDGIVIPHGESRDLYSKKYGTLEHNCDFYKENRACYNGVLDGQEEYKYSKCYDN